jgi:site-specific DNA recombinase
MLDFPEEHKGAKAVLYARVSSEEQAKGFSTDAQIKLLEEYARHPERNLQIEVDYYKETETAKVAGRRKFERMIAFLRENKDVRHILVEKTDRLYRNFKDYVQLEELDLVIHLVKENEILSKDSHSHAKFIHGIKVLMAKNYVDNLSEEVKKGMDQKAAKGQWPTRVPLGYKRNKETHLVDVDREKAPLVRQLFEAYAGGGYSLRELVNLSSRIGLRTTNNTRLNKAAVHRILGNIFYTGQFIYKGKVCREAVHEAIVTRDLFGQVQNLLRHPEKARGSKRSFAFGGLVKCHRCGCSMTPDMKMGKYVYYRCTEYKGRCKNSISEIKLAELLADVVNRIRVSQDVAEGLRIALHECQEQKVEFHGDSLRALTKHKKEIVARLNRAYEDKLDGNITEAFWRKKSAEWNAELVEIESAIASHRRANTNYLEIGNQIIELAKSARESYQRQSNQERRKLLDSVVSKITFADGTLYPTYRKPFDIFANGAETIKWRALRDEFLKSMNSTEVVAGYEVYPYQQVV